MATSDFTSEQSSSQQGSNSESVVLTLAQRQALLQKFQALARTAECAVGYGARPEAAEDPGRDDGNTHGTVCGAWPTFASRIDERKRLTGGPFFGSRF